MNGGLMSLRKVFIRFYKLKLLKLFLAHLFPRKKTLDISPISVPRCPSPLTLLAISAPPPPPPPPNSPSAKFFGRGGRWGCGFGVGADDDDHFKEQAGTEQGPRKEKNWLVPREPLLKVGQRDIIWEKRRSRDLPNCSEQNCAAQHSKKGFSRDTKSGGGSSSLYFPGEKRERGQKFPPPPPPPEKRRKKNLKCKSPSSLSFLSTCAGEKAILFFFTHVFLTEFVFSSSLPTFIRGTQKTFFLWDQLVLLFQGLLLTLADN